MAKYVCDFQTVTSLGDKLCSISADTTREIDSYNSQISSCLSSWSGNAKNSFEKANKSQVDSTKNEIKKLNELGEFIKKSAKSIQSLDDELARRKI